MNYRKIGLALAVMAAWLPVSFGALAAGKTADCVQVSAKGMVQFFIKSEKAGYALILPPGLLEKFPQKADYAVTLTTADGKSETLSGAGEKKGDNTLALTTSKRFKIKNLDRNALRSIDVRDASTLPNAGGCSGCPRDGSLQIYGDETICYCVH